MWYFDFLKFKYFWQFFSFTTNKLRAIKQLQAEGDMAYNFSVVTLFVQSYQVT